MQQIKTFPISRGLSVATIFLTSLSATGQLSAQTAQPPFALGHSDAKVIVGIDLKALRESQGGQFLGSQLGAMGRQLPPNAAPMAMFLPMAVQALSDIDTVLISSPGKPAGTPAPQAPRAALHSADNPPFLMVLEGRFASSPLNLLMGGTPEIYRGAKIYAIGAPAAGGATANARFTLVSANRLLVGDPASLHAALDKLGASAGSPIAPGISPALQARAQNLSRDHDIWVVVDEPLSQLQKNSPAMSGPASEIEGMEFALGLHDGFQLDVNMLTKNEETAHMMSQMLAVAVQSGMAAPQMTPDQAAMLASKLQVSSQGNRLTMSLKLTEAELERQILAAQPQHALASVHGDAPKPGISNVRVKPVASRKIKIYGLDEGTREIELKH